MVNIGSVSGFEKFGCQKSKNVHGIRKDYFETTLYVYASLVEFYMFVLDEILVYRS